MPIIATDAASHDRAPLDPPPSITRVALVVHDLQRVAIFYEKVIGLSRLRADGEAILLGAGGLGLLELRRDVHARRADRREAGLFHTAFLLPDRRALGGWLRRTMELQQPLLGAADHGVSEALYLADPEGNGIEVYADRPAADRRWTGGMVEMPNNPLDHESLLRQAAPWEASATVIGHVHLQVGDIPLAERFYGGTLGLAVTHRYPAASFYAAGGYHHQLATNTWNSRGAGRRDGPATGLAEVEMRFAPSALAAIAGRATDATAVPDGGMIVHDPWGMRFRLTTNRGSTE